METQLLLAWKHIPNSNLCTDFGQRNVIFFLLNSIIAEAFCAITAKKLSLLLLRIGRAEFGASPRPCSHTRGLCCIAASRITRGGNCPRLPNLEESNLCLQTIQQARGHQTHHQHHHHQHQHPRPSSQHVPREKNPPFKNCSRPPGWSPASCSHRCTSVDTPGPCWTSKPRSLSDPAATSESRCLFAGLIGRRLIPRVPSGNLAASRRHQTRCAETED